MRGDCRNERNESVEAEFEPPFEPYLPPEPNSFLVPVVRRAAFSFDGRVNMQQFGIMAAGIDATAWRTGALVFIVHARNNWGALGGTTAGFGIVARSAMLDPDEPDMVFVDNSRDIAGASLNSGTAIPRYSVSLLSPPYGPQLQVRWTWSQGAVPATAALTLACSVYFMGRRA